MRAPRVLGLACRRPLVGPVQPFGVRSTIIGQRGARASRCSRARCWMSRSRRAHGRARGQRLVHRCGIVALDEDGLVAVAAEQLRSSSSRDAREHGRVRDLVAVEMQDRAARRRRVAGLRNLFECQLVASGPVSASPSPTTQATTGRDCRTPRRTRARASSRARRPRGWSPASRARRGSGCRPETRTAGTGSACPLRPARCADRSRCTCLRDRRSRRAPGPPWPGPAT